jgi:H/ACA ribonucleoprotein complex subunit 3
MASDGLALDGCGYLEGGVHMLHILRCERCGSYGLDESCGCGGSRAKPKPPKYSPEDKYGDYRRRFKAGEATEIKEDDDEVVDDKSFDDKGDDGPSE